MAKIVLYPKDKKWVKKQEQKVQDAIEKEEALYETLLTEFDQNSA
jgi:hypothetical protein